MTANPSDAPTARWVHRSFLRDGKLRPRERYARRAASNLVTSSSSSSSLYIIPDGLLWRKYLGLFQTLLTKYNVNDDSNAISIQWILLESAAELMDHRSQSACLDDSKRREQGSSQERSTLLRLVRQHSLIPLCDLSVRDDDNDEWDWLGMEQLTIEERSRQAHVRAARLVREHGSAQAQVWLVSCKQDVDEHFQLDDGVEQVSIQDLLHRLVNRKLSASSDTSALQEVMRVCEQAYEHLNRPAQLLERTPDNVELSPQDIQRGLQTKSLLRGRLNVSKENPREAFVGVGNTQYFVNKQQGHCQRAFHGDVVIVQVLPETEWGRPVGRHRIVNYRDDDDDEITDDFANASFPPVPSARVVVVDQPSRRLFVATMVTPPRDNDSHVLVVPMDVRIPKIRIHSKFATTFAGMRLKVQVDGWDEGSSYPNGRCVQVMGPIGDLETELAALLLENQVELEPFSASAMACLPPQGDAWSISRQEIDQRRDLRVSRQIFSVDPPGCQDIDDTMHALELPNGDIEFGVHIADVTHLVPHNSALDIEAQLRGTTFYLVDRRFDMLPSLLSSNLCSLHGNVDRRAMSVIWVMSSDLKEIKSTWYGRTVIRNCAAMTYEQADRILRDEAPDDPKAHPPPPLTAGAPVERLLIKDLKPALCLLTRLARKLRMDRETIGGAVDLSSGDVGNELKFTLVDGKPVKVVPKTDKEIHHTIAEMMIFANTSVATKIYECFSDSALLRIHRTVEEERFEELRDVLEAGKIGFIGKSNADLAQSLKEARKRVNFNPVVSALLLSLATRAMSEAQYVSAGDILGDEANFSHYGLGVKYYTHFTSPIRRYADVVVHKQLLASLEMERMPTMPRSIRLPSQRQSLNELPGSNVISIMAGEGLSGTIEDDEDFLDGLIEGAADLALASRIVPDVEAKASQEEVHSSLKPYSGSAVSTICDGLNLHNRLAKYSSHECQRLFLSLYFRENVETTDAVVLNLRANGVWVYLPRFDMKAPIYLRDISGQVQVDPALLGLPHDAGLEATVGFSGTGTIRRFPDGQCSHIVDDDERVVVNVSGGYAFTVRPLDVVHVQVTCEKWDASARVPSPRVQLLKLSSVRSSFSTAESVKVSSRVLERRTEVPVPTRHTADNNLTVYSIVSSLDIRPLLEVMPPQHAKPTRVSALDRQATFAGRFIFSSFVNPDCRSTQQEIAQQNAASESAKRRANAIAQASHRSEFDTVKQYEREAMVRMQRLASDKRNARLSKAKKGK